MIDLPPDPIAFAIGPLVVHWYGIAYAVGLAAAYVVINREARWRKLDVGLLPNAMILVAIAALIYRVPVVLHDVLGWTAAEIASAMSTGLPATKQRLRRGRMMLVSALAEDDARRRASLAQPLRCWRARRHVSAYLDGELDPTTSAAVEAHLHDCPTCPPLYASLVGVRASLGGLRDPDTVVEEAMADRIRARLDDEPGRRPES